MDIIFNLVDNIVPDSTIVITIVFAEQYNVSIGKNKNGVTVYFYESNKSDVLKFCGDSTEKIKKYILEQVGDIPIHHISGISSVENKSFLKNNFTITDNIISDEIIDISKTFI